MKNRIVAIIVSILDCSLLGLWITVCLLLVFMWVSAYSNDLIPHGPWGIHEGNHGPWRGVMIGFINPHHPVYVLRKTVTWIIQLQMLSVLLAAVSLLFNRQKIRSVLLMLNVIYFFALGYTYYWLID